MLRQTQRAIEPRLGMRETLNEWQSIASGLAEANRKRRPQGEKLLQTS
jgi:hypothetical protein